MSSMLRQAIKNPRRTASVWASGPDLSRAMAKAVPFHENPFIVELGPGTGPVTQALLARFPKPSKLITIEANPSFGQAMRERFPDVKTAVAEAKYLPYVLRNFHCPMQVQAVVSSLGLRVMSEQTVEEILRAVDQSLAPGGAFVQYTYGLSSPIDHTLLKSLGWTHENLGVVWKNIPPASIHRYTKTSNKT